MALGSSRICLEIRSASSMGDARFCFALVWPASSDSSWVASHEAAVFTFDSREAGSHLFPAFWGVADSTACASTIIFIKKIAANPDTEAKRSDFWCHDGIQKIYILEKLLWTQLWILILWCICLLEDQLLQSAPELSENQKSLCRNLSKNESPRLPALNHENQISTQCQESFLMNKSVCIRLYVYICMYTSVYIHLYVYICMYTVVYTHLYVYICMYTSVCMLVFCKLAALCKLANSVRGWVQYNALIHVNLECFQNEAQIVTKMGSQEHVVILSYARSTIQ